MNGGTIKAAGAVVMQCLAGALLLLWPAFWSGRPTAFPDSVQYYSQGQYMAEVAGVGAPTIRYPDPYGVVELQPRRPADPPRAATVMGARSASYSAFLYLTAKLGGVWLSAGLQAFAAAWVLRLLTGVLIQDADDRRKIITGLAVMAVLAVGTTLPYFAGFLVPDLFAGLALALTALLLGAPARLSRAQAWGSAVLLAFFASTHGSIPLTIGALCAGWAGIKALQNTGARRILSQSRPVILALAAALAFNGLYAAVIRAGPAGPLTGPPFLTARVLEDQGGSAILAKLCNTPHSFAICRFEANRLTRSEDILWATEANRGAFTLADYTTRRRMAAEDVRFALAAFALDPGRQISASANDVVRQLSRFWVDDPVADIGFYLGHDGWRGIGLERVVFNAAACESGRSCRTSIPISVFGILPLITVCAGIGMLVWRLKEDAPAKGSAKLEVEALRTFSAVVYLVIAGVALNALVCGAISGPFPRYQARLIWLIPALGLLGCALPATRPYVLRPRAVEKLAV